MGKNIAMLVLAFITAVAMAATFVLSLRRLKTIERERWGDKA
jgi:hypothetical protein